MIVQNLKEEINYFTKYKKSLETFLNSESKNLTVKKYMKIVTETMNIETYIRTLNKKLQI